MSRHFAWASSCILTALLASAASVGCSSEPAADDEHAVSSQESALTVSQRKGRTGQIKTAAAGRGITNPLLIAGIAYHESGLAQCWSEATWSCPGPYSNECGGPVLTGSGDGPCSAQQGGIGMFQLDSGTWWQTLAQHGNGVLDVAGNVAAGTDFIVEKVRICPNTPSFANRQAVVDWINDATPGTAKYETFMTAMAWCYNGCAPSYTSCNHNAVRNLYKGATESLLSELGWSYWYTPEPKPEPEPEPVPIGGVAPGRGAYGRVGSNTDGRLEVFARGWDNAIWHAWQDSANSAFGGWSSLGGTLSSDPIVARNADGRLEVFARDGSGTLVQKWQSGSSWYSGWLSAGGVTLADGSSFAVGSNADGRLEVFGRTTGGEIVHRWQTAPNSGWSAWAQTGGYALDGPTLTRNGDGRLEVFVRGSDGAIWHQWQVAPSSGWSGWSSLGGETNAAPAAVTSGNGSVTLFATSSSGQLRWRAQTASGWWSAWTDVGGFTVDGGPTVVANTDGRIEVFAKSGSNIVHAWEWSAGAHDYTAMQPLMGGGAVSSAPSVGTSIDGRLELFARATDGSMAHVWQVPSGSDGWSGWSGIGGNVPSF